MNLSKEKQYSLLKLGAATVAVLLGIWFFLIGPAQARLSQKAKTSNDLIQKIDSRKRVIQQADQVKGQIEVSSQTLRAIEDQMVSGDTYLWVQKKLRDFEIPGQIEFSKYDPPQVIERNIPPKLPHKAALFVVTGTATYHDLGIFLANFENSYPHVRIQRLEMEPASLGTNDERLSFLFEMEVLMKPNPTTSGAKPGPRS